MPCKADRINGMKRGLSYPVARPPEMTLRGIGEMIESLRLAKRAVPTCASAASGRLLLGAPTTRHRARSSATENSASNAKGPWILRVFWGKDEPDVFEFLEE